MPLSHLARADAHRHTRIAHWIGQLGLAAGYILLGLVSNYYSARAGAVSIFWPGSGLVLGALLIGGRRFLLGALLGMGILNTLLHHAPWLVLGITLGSSLAGWFGYWLLTHHHRKTVLLQTLPSYLHLFVLGGCIASMVAALIGTLSLQLTGQISSSEYWHTVSHWWMGDILGVVLITPLMLAWQPSKHTPLTGQKWLIGITLLSLTLIAGQMVFLDWLNIHFGDVAKDFWMFLFISWVAIQLGVRATTFALVMIAIQALAGAHVGTGYFAHDIAQTHLHNYWAYILILSLVGMTMTIYVHEIKNNLAALKLKDTALNSTANSIVITDKNGLILWANQAFTHTTGYSLAEATGRNSGELVNSGKQDPAFYQAMWATLHDHRPWRGDLVNRRKDGSLHVEDMTITPLLDEHHTISHFVAVKQDITARKQLEQTLAVSDLALKSISQGILISDANQRIISVNQAFTDITGYQITDMLGQKCGMVQGSLTAPETVHAIKLAAQQQTTFTGEILNYRKDGSTFWNELTISPVFDPQGTLTHFIGITQDISKRKQLEAARHEALDLLQKVASRVPGLIYQLRLHPDGHASIPFASEAILNLYRITPASVREDASPLFAMLHPDDLDSVWRSIQQSAQHLTLWRQEHRVKFDDGSVRWLLGNALPEREADGGTLWHGFITDITEHKQMEEQVHQLAFYDALTQLPNRRLLDDRLSQAMATSKRNACYGAVIFLDLDNFKPLNDTYGHAVGDLLLIEAAHRLTSCVRKMDTVARFGGDEFVVILATLSPDKKQSIAEASVVAEKIRAALSSLYILSIRRAGLVDTTIKHHCTASIGVALFTHPEEHEGDILKWADTAMYQAKAAGRNLICFYEFKTTQ
ncbi:MAG: PAS domain S-box protein [Gallionella sp.]